MIPKTTMAGPGKTPHRPQMTYPPRRDPHTRAPYARDHRERCDRHGGLTGEFAALGSLFTAGYLFLVIL